MLSSSQTLKVNKSRLRLTRKHPTVTNIDIIAGIVACALDTGNSPIEDLPPDLDTFFLDMALHCVCFYSCVL
jgi:hypothetical protein